MTEKQIKIITTVGKIGGLATTLSGYLNFLPNSNSNHTLAAIGAGLFLASSTCKDLLMALGKLWDNTPPSEVTPAQSPKGASMSGGVGIFLAICLFAFSASAQPATNAPTPGSGTNTVQNLLGNLGGDFVSVVEQVGSDAWAAMSPLNWAEGVNSGVVGLWDGNSEWGAGVVVGPAETNAVMQSDFGFFALNKNHSWVFYDVTLGISVSKSETIPVIDLPVKFKVESGPAMAYNNHSWTGIQQSAGWVSTGIALSKKCYLEGGVGTVFMSDQDLPLYLAYLTLTYIF